MNSYGVVYRIVIYSVSAWNYSFQRNVSRCFTINLLQILNVSILCLQGAERKMRDEERKRSKRRPKNVADNSTC